MIDIETSGTGGGSIAWITREGHLKVGPRSAGAEPGPMCYPNGGDEPTITDANLVMGRIPSALIGGGIPPKILPALTRGSLREAFLDKGRQRDLLARIPLHVALEDEAALLGAARIAALGIR